MASLNRVTLIGFCGKDPEIRYLDSGIAVASLSIATTERGYTLANGTVVPERSEWHNIVAWRGLAEVCEKYIKKGSQLYVEGKLQTRSYDKNGQTLYRTDIIAETIQMLGKRPEGQQQSQQPAQNTQPGPVPPTMPGASEAFPTESSDDLPF